MLVEGVLDFAGDMEGSIKACEKDLHTMWGNLTTAYHDFTNEHSVVWEWEHDNDVPLQPGMLSIICDGAGTPRCVLETKRVEQLAYQDVTADFARAEGGSASEANIVFGIRLWR